MNKYDVVIVGSGSGGLTVAYTARGFGKSVLMIDKNKPGGECTWSGCIPSKALINQANDVYIAKKYNDFNIDTQAVMEKVRKVISQVYEGESIEVLRKDGIDFIEGVGKFVGNKVLEVNEEQIEAKKIFLCTGSSPMVPPIEGFENIDYLTNENFFLLEKLPTSMLVLGAGAIGVELSQAMNRLGVSVTLVEMADEILPREDQELTKILRKELEREGVIIHTSSKAVKAYTKDNQVFLEIENALDRRTVVGERILLALGRTPNVQALDLEKSAIEFSKKGITVNQYLETTCKGVYAVGDVTGAYMFSHMANVQGIKAVQNALLPINRKMSYQHVAWCTFSSPEIATAGMTEQEARLAYGDSIRIYRQSYDHLDRAKTKEGSVGLVKLICNNKGKVLGCSIIGDRAGEIIAEVQIIKTLGINFAKVSSAIHPYPTYSEILSKISKKVLVDNLLNMPIVKLFRKS